MTPLAEPRLSHPGFYEVTPELVLEEMASEYMPCEASERELEELASELSRGGTVFEQAFEQMTPAGALRTPSAFEPAAVIELDELRAAERDPRVIAELQRAREVGKRLQREGRIHR